MAWLSARVSMVQPGTWQRSHSKELATKFGSLSLSETEIVELASPSSEGLATKYALDPLFAKVLLTKLELLRLSSYKLVTELLLSETSAAYLAPLCEMEVVDSPDVLLELLTLEAGIGVKQEGISKVLA